MRTKKVSRDLPETALRYVLEGLVPYSDANLKLVFKPHLFFRDLEIISKRKERSLKNAYYKASKAGLIRMDANGTPKLTTKGTSKIKPYKPSALDKGARLVIIFDIPETERWKRQYLRLLLRELSFKQIQKSVWESKYDHREYLKAEIEQLDLQKYLIVYEALPIISSNLK